MTKAFPYDYIRYDSPLGVLTLAAREDALVALVMGGQRYDRRHLAGEGRARETPVLTRARMWLDRYFAGEKPDPCTIPLAPRGTPFQQRVWASLLTIPYGTTVTYGDLARVLGSSPRAVGGAVGKNPIGILIPCHRVLGSDGSLTGYAGGLENKEKLLRLEGCLPVR